MKHTAACSIVLAFGACTAELHGAVLYAKTAATGAGDCTTWADACTLSTAIAGASANDQIWVKTGTYGPISLKSGVRIIGGFAGSETAASQCDPDANPTVIEGGGTAQAVLGDGEDSATMLRGFRITAGNDSGMIGGGGMQLKNSQVRVVDCVFDHNTAAYLGGAVAILEGGAPEFVNCIFADNGETLGGGAVYLDGGSAKFVNCLFYRNKGGDGGAFVHRSGSPTFVNCTMVANEATVGSGGAIHDEKGRALVQNTIIWNNAAEHSAPQIYNGPDGVSVVRHSNVQGGWAGTGNIDADPLFVDAGLDDYRLASNSPCRDAGKNSYLPADGVDLDWDGNTTELIPHDLADARRVFTTTVDIGAYEWVECTTDPDCPSEEVCCNNQCVECCDDDDCDDLVLTKCRLSDHTCVQCLSDDDCGSGCCKSDGNCGPCGGGGGPGGGTQSASSSDDP